MQRRRAGPPWFEPQPGLCQRRHPALGPASVGGVTGALRTCRWLRGGGEVGCPAAGAGEAGGRRMLRVGRPGGWRETTTPRRQRGGGTGAGRRGELQLPWGRGAGRPSQLRKRAGELQTPARPARRRGAGRCPGPGQRGAEAARRGRAGGARRRRAVGAAPRRDGCGR